MNSIWNVSGICEKGRGIDMKAPIAVAAPNIEAYTIPSNGLSVMVITRLDDVA